MRGQAAGGVEQFDLAEHQALAQPQHPCHEARLAAVASDRTQEAGLQLHRGHGLEAAQLAGHGQHHRRIGGGHHRLPAEHAAGIWAFEDLSSRRKLKVEFTAREREIAALLVEGLTSKLIGKRLAISPRTVDVYRARLMRKMGAATTPELVNKLLSG